VDYEKAFDSIKHHKLFKALAGYTIDIRQHIYERACVRVHEKTDKFRIEWGVRQRDQETIFSKFTTLLEYMFKSIKLEDLDVNINGENLNFTFC